MTPSPLPQLDPRSAAVFTPGYSPIRVFRFNGNADFNVFIGGVWIVVDALTGAIFQLDVPPDRRGELLPDRGDDVGIMGSTSLTVSIALKPEPGARRIGRLERQ